MKTTLRPFQQSDAQSLVRHANNPRIARNMTDGFPHPYGPDDAQTFLDRVMASDPSSVLAIDFEGEAIGAIGLHRQEDIYRLNAELGYWLAEPHWGKGIMTGAIRQMVTYGFETFDFDRIYATPFGSNQASQRILEKVGFVLEGRFEETLIKWGALEDELVYAIRRKDWNP